MQGMWGKCNGNGGIWGGTMDKIINAAGYIIKCYHELMGRYLDDAIPISDSVQYIDIRACTGRRWKQCVWGYLLL